MQVSSFIVVTLFPIPNLLNVDYNRTGVPLLEIVSEPDIRSGAEARAYVEKLRSILQYLEVSDGRMEEGSLRCDCNVSVRLRGATEFGTRTETKNVNSLTGIQKAISTKHCAKQN